jgi:sigma-E factor negative regulatory protein RseB
MRHGLFILGLACGAVQASDILPAHEAAAWLQGIADASNRNSFQGTFVYQSGDRMQTLQIANRPSSAGKESRLVGMDGEQREVRCTRGESVSIVGGVTPRLERRVGSRHFPDLLPADAGRLVSWYDVRLGQMDRVAGLDCRALSLEPKDRYRWGYTLCIEKDSKLPLKAALVDARGKPLMQYAFAEVQIGPAQSGAASPSLAKPASVAAPRETPKAIDTGAVAVGQLPPGYSRVIAVKRPLAKVGAEVEHWVFSDGLTNISMFVEPARDNVNLRGASQRGMTNLRTLRVGNSQVTVVGDAPPPAVDMIVASLESSTR